MLETERYGEAADLLRFLLQCQGQDPRHYEEWQALLDWLISAFPKLGSDSEDAGFDHDDDDDEEALARQHVEAKLAEDQDYADKLLRTVMDKPLSEQTFLALEQLAYLDRSEVDDELIQWLTQNSLHPLLQYRVLQILKRRGTQGVISLYRRGELVNIEIEAVPLKPEDFPQSVQSVLERVGAQTQVHDPTLFYFAQELWTQFVMAVYGTMDYNSMMSEDHAVIDIWAAALHQMISDSLPGGITDEEIRGLYGITDSLRLRFEQACRSMRQFVAAGAHS
ncbi:MULTISPECIES: hypothetical protein [Fontibacillus]|nr:MULTISPECIES: hypothetical protein [Fontibacillus]